MNKYLCKSWHLNRKLSGERSRLVMKKKSRFEGAGHIRILTRATECMRTEGGEEASQAVLTIIVCYSTPCSDIKKK